MKSILDIIRDHPFLSSLDETSLELIAGCGQNVVFHEGDYIMREGGDADQFFLMRSGRAALETFVPGRGAVVFQTLKAGDMLGVSWLVAPYSWDFDARAVEEIRATAFDAKCLRTKCDENHDMGYALMQLFVPALVERLRATRLQWLDLYAERGTPFLT